MIDSDETFCPLGGPPSRTSPFLFDRYLNRSNQKSVDLHKFMIERKMSKNETSESSGISTSNSNDSLNTTEYTSSKIAWVGHYHYYSTMNENLSCPKDYKDFIFQRKCRSSLKNFGFRKRRNTTRSKEELTSRDIHVSHSVDFINQQKKQTG